MILTFQGAKVCLNNRTNGVCLTSEAFPLTSEGDVPVVMYYLSRMKNESVNVNDNFVIVLLWAVLFSITCFQAVTQTSFFAGVLFSLVFILCLSFPLTYITRKMLVTSIKSKKYGLFVFQFIVSALLTCAILAFLTFFMRTLEINGITTRSGYFEKRILHDFVEFFTTGVIINICVFGFCFILEYLNSQKVILEYQLRTLKHQVTPHFMFNVLNHIHILMQTDVKLASSLLIRYSEILRYQLYSGDKEKVALREDVQFLKDFIAVEKVRWEDKLTLNDSWDIEDDKIEIPPLLFITFIENAFKHVSKSNFEKGYIAIDFKQQGNMISLVVENSKSTIKSELKSHNGLGLKNIKERMDILYNGKHLVSIDETDSIHRIKVTIKI